LYVSDWAGKQVLAVDPGELRVVAKIAVGEHPNQMVLHKDGRLFVACASSNCVSVIDTKRAIVTETIYTSLFPKAPEGSTPDAVALAPDGETLFVANADNNCVAAIDVENAGQSGVKGFNPPGGTRQRSRQSEREEPLRRGREGIAVEIEPSPGIERR
jgi:YVTN family beta-propeller protein